MDKKRVAVIGATGVVGRTIAQVLELRSFPVSDYIPAATEASAGNHLEALGRSWAVENAARLDYGSVDICFFTAGAAVSRDLVPRAVDAGSRVVDNTTAFRMEPRVPLAVPEINAHTITADTPLVSCPNCTTIVLVMSLAPVVGVAEVERVVVTSFQSVSGAGKRAVDELERQTASASAPAEVFERPIAFNCVPLVGSMQPSGYTSEEEKIVEETRKILGKPNIQVVPTAVRVPVRVGHSLSVNVEFAGPVDLDELKQRWNNAPGVKFDETFATPLEVAGTDDVIVGRLRRDPTRPSAISYWAVGDNLRKGAATNSVQIAEVMLKT